MSSPSSPAVRDSARPRPPGGPAAAPPRTLATLPRRFWLTAFVVFLGSVYVVLHASLVLPWFWPAGLGLRLAGDSAYAGAAGETPLLIARPPNLAAPPAAATVAAVVPGGPAAAGGVGPGDRLVAWRSGITGVRVDLSRLGEAEPAERLRAWRDAWHAGLRGPVELELAGRGPGLSPRITSIDRLSAWASPPVVRRAWLDRHAGLLARAFVFMACALALLLLKGHDPTGAVAAAALTFCTVGATGPLVGSERILPPIARETMAIFTWTATPLAFAFTALAIVFFPRPSTLVVRRPWLLAVPFLVVSPMLVPSAATGLYLAGIEAAAPLALWDATHPGAFLLAFGAALLVNAATLGEGVWRYARNPDLHERRRIRLAIATTVVGVLSFVLKDGLPVLSSLAWGGAREWPVWAANVFHLLIVLPALGVTYAVVVHRVLGPRMALRRSLQYALARRTLTVVASLPALLLVWSLVRRRHEALADIVSGAPAFYLGLLALSVAALRYRERAGQWLDVRFFRTEYDARRVLLSLAGRVRFETDPAELTDLVLREIEQALHPHWAGFLAGGLEPAHLVPVATRGGAAAPLAAGGGLAALLTWSDRPLEIDLTDPGSVGHRLPPEDREWLASTGAVLLVPVVGLDRELAGVIALGEKRSEEPYTSEDRELLASIAGQVALGFDVARLRVRLATAGDLPTVSAPAPRPGEEPALVECPRCGRCAGERTARCPDDGEAMRRVPGLTHVIERKYRVDRLLGRGGMGAVYRARDVGLERDVAIKVIRASLADAGDARRRFRREARIVARLKHPGIVTVHDFGTLPTGAAFIVMELLEGASLRELLRREGRLGEARARRIAAEVGRAVAAAHAEGVLHRDLKPENIFFVRQADGTARVKVLDFGVARVAPAAGGAEPAPSRDLLSTGVGSVVGTPAYMPPEQLRGDAVDVRSDVYSLAVVTYELLTGDLPFGSASVAEIATRQLQPPLMDPALVPVDLASLLARALAADPAQRPPDALAFAREVEGEPA